MEKVKKTVNYCDKEQIIETIEKILQDFFYSNKINFNPEDGYTFFENLDKYITKERLKQGWLDEKGRPLSNLIKRYIPRAWTKLTKWNDIWSKIVNEIKKQVANQEIAYWEEDVEFFDSEEYDKYSWGDNNSCFRKGNSNEIVQYILKWNSQYVKLGLFQLQRENYYHRGRVWVFKFPNCIIITNLYFSLSEDKNKMYTDILELVMQYNKLDTENWYYTKLKREPFQWFYWNRDAYIILPKGSDINEIIDEIRNLQVNLNCPHDCDIRLSMKVPELKNGIVYCRGCSIAICSNCGKLTYNATNKSDSPLCEDCAYFCNQCGRLLNRNESHYVDGYYYCNECFEENWAYCVHCREIVDIENTYWLGDYSYCESCFDELFFVCDHCEGAYRRNTVNQVKCIDENGNKVIFCQMCADRWTETCQICNRKVHIDYMKVIDEKRVCEDCYEEGIAC